MSSEPRLEYTVYHKGRKYRAGTPAGEIEPAVVAELGDHVWAGGNLPAKAPAIPPTPSHPDGPASPPAGTGDASREGGGQTSESSPPDPDAGSGEGGSEAVEPVGDAAEGGSEAVQPVGDAAEGSPDAVPARKTARGGRINSTVGR